MVNFKKQKKINIEVYSLSLRRRVVSLADLGAAVTLDSIRHIVTKYVIKINN